MKLNEITDPLDTPILISIIRRKLAKGERVWLDATFDASNCIGMENTHDKFTVTDGIVTEAHDAQRIGGDSNPNTKDPNRLEVDIEYMVDVDPDLVARRGRTQSNEVVNLWADVFDQTFTLKPVGRFSLKPASPSPSWILTNEAD
jgi:hypothetical protein